MDVDASGNIAVATEPYALVQDAATACRTFQGECWYDTTVGVPYWTLILGERPPISLIKSVFESAALTVPGVVSATFYLGAIIDRQLTGQIQVTNSSGTVSVATV